MTIRISATIAAVALSGTVCAAQGPALRFSPALPEGWREQAQVMLVLQDVTVPRNAAATLRVYALEQDGRHLLGSYGLPAESPDAPGSATHTRLPVPVTATLRKWKNAPASGEKIQILVEPVDAKGRPLKAYDWKARDIAFEVRK
jgi:hypothetical protein